MKATEKPGFLALIRALLVGRVVVVVRAVVRAVVVRAVVVVARVVVVGGVGGGSVKIIGFVFTLKVGS